MIDHQASSRARILALTFAAFGAVGGCGGSSEPAPAQNTSAQSSGSEQSATQPAGAGTETPASTQGTTSADVNPDTACGHGACT